MRRTAAAIAGTVIAIWLVLSFKSSPLPRTTAVAGTAAPDTTAPQTVAGAGGQPAAGAAPPPSPGPATTQPAPSGTRTVIGQVEPNRYGNVQVAVVLNGTRITDVKTLQMPFDRARSADISSQAAPLLRAEVLQAQSAQIDTIGGATYTSDGYARSLQAALDTARA
jgi:hypothetical protein